MADAEQDSDTVVPSRLDPDDPTVVAAWLREATDRVLLSAEGLDAAEVREPSLCPGWSRAHVVAHLVGNAEGVGRLLRWAETGVPHPKYPDLQAREDEIERLADEPWPQLREALTTSAHRLQTQQDHLPVEAWAREVPTAAGGVGEVRVAATIPWTRLREVELHHVDLDVGYTPAHWPEGLAEQLVVEAIDRLAYRERPTPPPALVVEATDAPVSGQVGGSEGAVLVSGPARALAAWLTGRGSGDGLVTEPPGPLPELPPWG